MIFQKSYGSYFSIFIVPFRLLLSGCITFIQLPFYYALTLSVPKEKRKDWYFYSASWQKRALKFWLILTNKRNFLKTANCSLNGHNAVVLNDSSRTFESKFCLLVLKFWPFKDSSCLYAFTVAYNGDSLQSQRKTDAERCVSYWGQWRSFLVSWFMDLFRIFVQSRPNGNNYGGLERKQSFKT